MPASAQDAEKGNAVFNKCRACHQIGESAKNAVGPHLNGLIGREVGTVEGYSYSGALRSSGTVWDEAIFSEYIRNPRARFPGTKMMFPGLTKDDEIGGLLIFLKQFKIDGSKD